MIVTTSGPQVRRASDTDATGELGALDRYLIESGDSGGTLAVVEHTLASGVLAAPVHRHSREDEYSVVLEGRLGCSRTASRCSPPLAT